MPRNTGTILTDSQGNNRTATHLSTNIIIKVDGNTVGAVQSMSVREERQVTQWSEVGGDGIIDSAPTQSATVAGSCSRIRFDRMRIAESLSRSFLHVKSQRIPFDFEIHDTFADADPGNAIITVIKNVWMKQISYNYKSSDFIIIDDMDWIGEDIYSLLNNGNVAQAVANGRSNPIKLNAFEREADRGLYRGALDANGLISALTTDIFE